MYILYLNDAYDTYCVCSETSSFGRELGLAEIKAAVAEFYDMAEEKIEVVDPTLPGLEKMLTYDVDFCNDKNEVWWEEIGWIEDNLWNPACPDRLQAQRTISTSKTIKES